MLRLLKNLLSRPKFSDYLNTYHKKYKSDKRLPGGKNGICVICNKETTLRLSHIVPKWCYKWCKKEGEGKMCGSYASINIQTKEQDGSKHYLLCENCEQYLGVAEQYVKILMHGSEQEIKNVGIKIEGADYKGLNSDLVYRFVCGLVFKSHFATSAPFHKIKLDTSQIELLRKKILTTKGSNTDLTIVAMKFYSEDPEIDPKAIIIPHQTNTKKAKFISFLIAGWEWILFFNTKKIASHENFSYMQLLQTGEMRIPSGNILEQRYIMNRLRIKPQN